MRRRITSALLAVLATAAASAIAPSAVSAAPSSSGISAQLPETDLGIPLPVPIPGVGGPCDIPGVDHVCNAVGGALSKIPNPISAAAGFVAGEAEKAFTHWLADGAASVLGDVLQAADATLQPDLGPRSFFAGRLQSIAGLAGGVALLFLLFAVGHALLRGDPLLIAQALLVRLPVAFGVSAALLFLAASGVAVVDQATAYVIGGSVQDSAAQFMKNLADAFGASDFGGVGMALVALCALGTILVGILLYVELAVRAAVIYLALLFMPLGLAASVWASAGRVAHRLADVLVAAILSKFVILVSLWFAAGLLQQASSDGAAAGFGSFVIGLVVLFVAAASPLVLVGLVAHAEHAVTSIAGARRAAYAPPRAALAYGHAGARAALTGMGGGAGVAIHDGTRQRPGGAGSAGGATGGSSGPRAHKPRQVSESDPVVMNGGNLAAAPADRGVGQRGGERPGTGGGTV